METIEIFLYSHRFSSPFSSDVATFLKMTDVLESFIYYSVHVLITHLYNKVLYAF